MMMNNQRRSTARSPSTDEQLHRSTHTWRPVVEKSRARPTVIYRSALYIEPKRSSFVVVPSRYTTVSPPQPMTHRRETLIDDLGYETESK